MLCVFDCETIPDVDLIREIYGYCGDDLDISNQALSEHFENTGSSFLPLPFHKIISIAGLICYDDLRIKRIGNYSASFKGRSEEKILSDFLDYFNRNNPKLVSFNGRNFDIPLIMLRSLKYNLNASAYFDVDNPLLNKNKWDNYRSRYSENFHIDLLDSLSSFGATRSLKLDLVCKMSGIPGKIDTSGDDVLMLYYNGRINDIDDYCQSDVLNTYWLFLKYLLLQDRLSISEYAALLANFSDNISDNKYYSCAFKNAISKEITNINNRG